jgi:predicted DNA repair protein MutK
MVVGLPVLIRVIGAVGTAALILVAGGIFHHHLPLVHGWAGPFPGWVFDAILGLTGGALTFVLVKTCGRVFRRSS